MMQESFLIRRRDLEEAIESVSEFVCLGCLLTESGGNTNDIARRINFGTLKLKKKLTKSLLNQPVSLEI